MICPECGFEYLEFELICPICDYVFFNKPKNEFEEDILYFKILELNKKHKLIAKFYRIIFLSYFILGMLVVILPIEIPSSILEGRRTSAYICIEFIMPFFMLLFWMGFSLNTPYEFQGGKIQYLAGNGIFKTLINNKLILIITYIFLFFIVDYYGKTNTFPSFYKTIDKYLINSTPIKLNFYYSFFVFLYYFVNFGVITLHIITQIFDLKDYDQDLGYRIDNYWKEKESNAIKKM